MFFLFIFVIAAVVMWLWNALIPDLFHGPVLGYWQALGLLLLVRLFVGRVHHGSRRPWRKWRGRYRDEWHRRGSHKWGRWDDPESRWDWSRWGGPAQEEVNRWKSMTPEEKRRMKEEWKCEFRKRYSNRGHAANEAANSDVNRDS
jgi:hypothetical protein